MNFSQIDKIIILGGGERVKNFLEVSRDFETVVITSERLLKEKLPQSDGIFFQEYLKNNSIVYYSTDNINDFPLTDYINNTTLGISIGAPWIFKNKTIQKFKGKLINAHGSRLPQDRGGGGYSWQIMRGLILGYHLFHIIDSGIDTGSIIVHDEFLFPDSCKKPIDYMRFSAEKEIEFFYSFLNKIKEQHIFQNMSQTEFFSSYFPRLSTLHHGYVNWDWSLKEIESFICAFDDPYDGASTFYCDEKIFIKSVTTTNIDGNFHPFMNGLIYRKNKDALFVCVREGTLIIRNIIDQNGHNILNSLKVGNRLYTPLKHLEEARQFRAIYSSKGLKINEKNNE